MKKGVLNISEIQKYLPYRYPMLLVDGVCLESENKIIGYKNISINEEVFLGHFPDHPIVPGVLQVEAMEQVAEIAVCERINPGNEKDIFIKTLDKVKFRSPNIPGNRMKIEVDILEINNNEAKISALTRNKEGKKGITCQAEMTLSVREKSNPGKMPELFTEMDKSDDIAMDVQKIKELMPHRYPFLFVDYIKSVDEKGHVIGIKNTTYNEPVFRGYKKDYPVLPGAIQSEIVAQAGCVSVLARPENEGKIAYYMSIDHAEFYHPVFPGDQLICEVDLPPAKSRFGKGKGFIRVGDKVVSSTKMTFALIKP